MSERIGVISWNVTGDLPDGGGPECVNRLWEILDDLEASDFPVHFLCFQETSGSNGSIMSALAGAGYTCHSVREGNGEGKWYLFALHPNSGFTFDKAPEQCLFHYENPSGSPLRYPSIARLTRSSDGRTVALYTLHASLDGALVEGLQKTSALVNNAVQSGQFDNVYIAGDLNILDSAQIYDERTGKMVNFLKKLFPDFVGSSHNLDHIFRWPGINRRNLTGFHYDAPGDHALIYTCFKVS